MHQSLPDYLAPGLKLLSIGLNPSLPSVKAGYYFANPRNRFWKALNGSRLIQEALQPGVSGHQILMKNYHIGFTDVVKRPTASAKDLSARDFHRDVPSLLEKIVKYRPVYCWFHGKIALRNTLRVAGLREELNQWGIQSFQFNDSKIFMSPNPSPANAVFSLTDLIDSYNQLFDFMKRGSDN